MEEAVQQYNALSDAMNMADILTADTPSTTVEVGWEDIPEVLLMLSDAIGCAAGNPLGCGSLFVNLLSATLDENSFHVNPDFEFFDLSLDFQIDPENAPLFEPGSSYLANSSFLSYGNPYSLITIDSFVDNGSSYSLGVSIQGLNQVQPVPEPATIALLGIGIVGLAGVAVRHESRDSDYLSNQ